MKHHRSTSEVESQSVRQSSPAPVGSYLHLDQRDNEPFAAHSPKAQRLTNQRASLERLPASGECYRISSRDAVRNQSFQVLLPIPPPDLGKELATVVPSPPGTNQWAVVVGRAGWERLENRNPKFRVGQRATVAVDIHFEGTTVTALELGLPPADEGLHCG